MTLIFHICVPWTIILCTHTHGALFNVTSDKRDETYNIGVILQLYIRKKKSHWRCIIERSCWKMNNPKRERERGNNVHPAVVQDKRSSSQSQKSLKRRLIHVSRFKGPYTTYISRTRARYQLMLKFLLKKKSSCIYKVVKRLFTESKDRQNVNLQFPFNYHYTYTYTSCAQIYTLAASGEWEPRSLSLSRCMCFS